MAMGVVGLHSHRHPWMIDRDGLGRHCNRSMAYERVDLETLGYLHRCAMHHAP